MSMSWSQATNLLMGWQLNKGWDVFDAGEIDELAQMMEEYGDSAQRVIDEVLHGEGAEEIKLQIARILPVSGRRWRGKRSPASSAMPGAFDQDDDMLAVTIAARGNYSYLYFPDDGSNTVKHAGNQQFMKRGAENATSRIVELCLGKLV